MAPVVIRLNGLSRRCAKVGEAGLSNTQITSPDGFSDSEDMYTTAYDLAHPGLAMGYEVIAGIVSQATAEIA